jgi:hypothetical protein
MKAMRRESPIPHAPSALANMTALHAARERSRRHIALASLVHSP